MAHNKAALAQPKFLPTSPEELAALGWPLDILLVSGDAYVDHPSFAMALLGRWLVEHGYGVAILPQPAWEPGEASPDPLATFTAFPRPRLFAGVSAGAIDSMLAHYTAFRKKRHDDAYTPGGKAGARPNRASMVYTGLIRRAWPGLPVILGGLEASLRRVSHYDFWGDSLRKSILPDSKADIILCGMAEESILSMAHRAEKLLESFPKNADRDAFRKALARDAATTPGAVTIHSASTLAEIEKALPEPPVRLASHDEILKAPGLLVKNTVALEEYSHQGERYLTQGVDANRSLLLAPPPAPIKSALLDKIYNLPYSRLPHPMYKEAIPAWEMIRTSITTHRGCGGGCSFCSLALHQGRHLSSRSEESILAEARLIASGPEPGKKAPKWAGAISDVGGPSANMWQGRCAADASRCRRASCLFPAPCPQFKVDQGACADLLRAVSAQPGVRHVRVASGVRYDMALADPKALAAYTMEFTGGQLKVAPEHISPNVLEYMRKPRREVFENFIDSFKKLSTKAGKEQYVVAYLISAFPGCTTEHMQELKAWLGARNWSPKQVQCFIPTPGTVATAMYYAGEDPKGKKIYVAKSDKDRMAQHYILLGEEKSLGRRPKPRF